MPVQRQSVTSQRGFRHLPCAGTAAHDLVRLLHDQLAPRLALALGGILALSLIIAHVHELRVVVAVCFPKRQHAGDGGGGGGGVSKMPGFSPSCFRRELSAVTDSNRASEQILLAQVPLALLPSG